jgi:hypothetical protein
MIFYEIGVIINLDKNKLFILEGRRLHG